jgi:poly-gamma-glutamate capsule biosynthesis protein CapA/YwtB (metallophosphatase superfamily)
LKRRLVVLLIVVCFILPLSSSYNRTGARHDHDLSISNCDASNEENRMADSDNGDPLIKQQSEEINKGVVERNKDYWTQLEKSEKTNKEVMPYNEQSNNASSPTEIEGLQSDQYLQKEEAVIGVTISFAGDCTLGTDESFSYVNSFPYRLEKENNDYSYFFEGVRGVFATDDLTLVNLETTLTTATRKAEKAFRFKGDPSYVEILKEGHIEMVNISNNHIYDYLQKGFDETLKNLEKGGVMYSGEGHIAYYSIKGITIASIGYGGWSTSIQDDLEKDIKLARENADLIIVSFHWGKERSFYPLKAQTDLGRFSIDKGADVVVGHHPHVIQGIEKYKGKYIVYSLGNFCFGGNRNPSDKDSFIFQSHFILKGKRVVRSEGQIIPCSISSVDHVNDYQPTILEGDEKEEVLERIYKYSSKLKYGIKRDE